MTESAGDDSCAGFEKRAIEAEARANRNADAALVAEQRVREAEMLVRSQRDVYENEREEYAEHVAEMGEKLRLMSNARIDAEREAASLREKLDRLAAAVARFKKARYEESGQAIAEAALYDVIASLGAENGR